MTSANGNRQHRTSSAPSDSKRALAENVSGNLLPLLYVYSSWEELQEGSLSEGYKPSAGMTQKSNRPTAHVTAKA